MFLLFDMDGVLLDSMPLWLELAARYLRAQARVPEAGIFQRIAKMTMRQCAEYLREHYHLPQTPEQIVNGLDGMAASFYQTEAPLKPGVAETLAELRRRGHICAVATATDRPLAEAAFRRTGIAAHFDRIFTCSEFGLPKTSPEFYQRILAELHIPPKRLIVIEDVLHAIETAKHAGIDTIALYDEASRANWPRIQATATHACQTFPDLLNLL